MKTTEIAASLNARGIPTPMVYKKLSRRGYENDAMWSHQAVLRIIRDYKYTGAMVTFKCENLTIRAKGRHTKDPRKNGSSLKIVMILLSLMKNMTRQMQRSERFDITRRKRQIKEIVSISADTAAEGSERPLGWTNTIRVRRSYIKRKPFVRTSFGVAVTWRTCFWQHIDRNCS